MPIPTPHLAPIPQTLSDGKEITVEGQINPNANRFTISLCAGNDLSHDTPVTFDVRFNENVVVRNHYQGNWGGEDRSSGFPFKRGENVEVKIVVRNDQYQFFVNKQHFCDFKHRIGKETARNVFVQGDITIHKIDFSGSGGSQHQEGHSLQDPAVPLLVPIGAVRAGRKIIVAGVPTGSERFSVNVTCGQGANDDIGLHIDVRFNFGKSHNKVVINHRAGGKWGGEDLEHHGFPFAANQPFELVIKVKDDFFKITVNDEKFDNVEHRIKPDRLNCLQVVGNVKLNYVKM